MKGKRSQRGAVIAAVGINIVIQLGLLWLLALYGEWRVFRFLANAQAQMDALVILFWIIARWRDAGARKVAC